MKTILKSIRAYFQWSTMESVPFWQQTPGSTLSWVLATHRTDASAWQQILWPFCLRCRNTREFQKWLTKRYQRIFSTFRIFPKRQVYIHNWTRLSTCVRVKLVVYLHSTNKPFVTNFFRWLKWPTPLIGSRPNLGHSLICRAENNSLRLITCNCHTVPHELSLCYGLNLWVMAHVSWPNSSQISLAIYSFRANIAS